VSDLATPPEALRLARSLDGAWYADAGVFAAELEAFYARRWVAVGRGSELPEPGDYVTREVAGESLLVVRAGDGTAGAFYNVCRHRGARLVRDEAGRCPAVIRCPYHAWSYGLDGALRGAPNLPDAHRERWGGLGLHRVALEERYGSLWVNLAGDAGSFDADVGEQVRARMGTDALVARWGLEHLALGRELVYDVGANWKLLVENFSECYHCGPVHPELTSVIPEFKRGRGTLHSPGYGAGFTAAAAGFTVDGRAGLPRLPGLTDAEDRRYYAIVLTPNVFLHLVPDHVVLHRLEPLAPDRTRVVCSWLFAPETLTAGLDIEPSVQLFHTTNLQDFDVCERCQLGARSRAFAGARSLVPVEEHLAAFHDEVRAAVGAAAPASAASRA
jgi:Rieske 2Fe-2S family protein